MKNKIRIVFIVLVSIVIGIGVDKLLLSNNNDINNSNTSVNKKGTFTNRLSMMLETGTNTKMYEKTESNSWPTTGYKFNSKLSKCENGGSLKWDYTNKQVLMVGNASDKCYVYFDALASLDTTCSSGDNLAECIKTYGDQGYDVTSIYVHNSSLTNGAGDNSYRFAGPSDYVNNFVCFGTDASTCPTDNLYRIIGVFGDQVKLIKYDYATSTHLGTNGEYSTYTYSASSYANYQTRGNLITINGYFWDNTNEANVWANSALNIENLNINYITYLNNQNSKWTKKIAETSWKVGGNTWANIGASPMNTAYQNEIVSPAETTTYSAKIGLMYVSDYGYAASPTYWTYPQQSPLT